MACTGHCFDDIELPPNTVPPSTSPVASLQSSATEDHAGHYVYKALHRWQTRVIRLHPAAHVKATGLCESQQLHAELLTVNLHATEGVTAEGTEDILNYQALSYSWGHPELDDVLICNGAARPISHSNGAALRALRHDSRPVFLWIDAICINQEDDQEKSEQVANMLTIYKKAQSVIAWLGEPDANSALALHCMEGVPSIERALLASSQRTHGTACIDKLEMIHAALLGLHSRPLLGRTWVRQEIYAARQLIVQCGLVKRSWENFMRSAGLIATISPLLTPGDVARQRLEVQVSRLLYEAQRNTYLPLNGVKPPRNLIEVLLQSSNFAVSNPKDTFYAVLGMCNVASFTKASIEDHNRSQNAVLLDYAKTTVEVLQDATLYLMNRENDPTALANLWHSYKRGDQHSQGLPSWAVDWRSGTFDDVYRANLQNAMRTQQEIFPRPIQTGGFCNLFLCEWVSSRSGENLPEDGSVDIHLARHWIPLWSASDHGQRARLMAEPDAFELVPTQVLTLPDILQPDRSMIGLKARALNYVAHLTDYTCDLEHFLTATNHFHRGFLGLEGLSIHARKLPRKNHTFLRMTELGCESLKLFEAASHSVRLAILGVGNDAQVALVPSTAKKGDIVIAIAPGMLPMLIRPLQGHSTAAGLLPGDDPYEYITPSTDPDGYERAAKMTTVMLVVLLVAFHPTLTLVPIGSTTGIALLVCYGVLIPTCLACSLWIIHLSLRRTHLHPLVISDLDDECILVVWEKLMLYVTLISFPVCIAVTKGPLQIVFSIYFVLTSGSLLLGRLWLYQRRLSDNITIARRRTHVFAVLDKVSETLNCDFEFHGPIFVKMDRVYWSFPRWFYRDCFRRCFFKAVLWAHNSCTKAEQRLRTDDLSWFFTEVYTSRGAFLFNPHLSWQSKKLFPWHNDKVRAWDRPVQEFRLR